MACKNFDMYIVGVGGQGVLTIGDLIAEAAVREDVPVNVFPTKGMAQRGGHVKEQIRIGCADMGPSLPPASADLVVAMELSEALKAVRYVKPGGEFVLYGHVWAPTAVMLGKADYPKLEQVKEAIKAAGAKLVYLDPAGLPVYNGLSVRDNIFVLGAVMNTKIGEIFSKEDISASISSKWPKGAEANIIAYEAGLKAVENAGS